MPARPAIEPSEPALLFIREPSTGPRSLVDWRERLERLRAELRACGRVVVAYSGGVDSSVLLAVAHEQLGPRALGVIGVSDSYSSHELRLALEQAARIGARVETAATGELADPRFASNPTDRCYHCKRELYARLAAVAVREESIAGSAGADGQAPGRRSLEPATGGGLRVVIVDGTIADDLSDWRPGRRAAAEHAVRSPLAELGFTKADVRAAAEALGLSSAAKPASPCLASRIPYGMEITRERLDQIERAEALLRELGFSELRVRHHGDTARIEVATGELGRLLEPEVRDRVTSGLKALGFRWVTADLVGFRSGNLNPPSG